MSLRTFILGTVLSLQLAAVTFTAQAGEDKCKRVSGPFSSVAVLPPECQSPVGICTRGLLTGNFHAIYEFTMLTLVPANDPNDPTAFVYTGQSVITLQNGKKLFAVDTGIMHIADPTAVPFVTTANIVSGTGQYETGQIVASGILNLVTGDAIGSYTGEICKAKPPKAESAE